MIVFQSFLSITAVGTSWYKCKLKNSNSHFLHSLLLIVYPALKLKFTWPFLIARYGEHY